MRRNHGLPLRVVPPKRLPALSWLPGHRAAQLANCSAVGNCAMVLPTSARRAHPATRSMPGIVSHRAMARWDTIPGIDRVAGWALLAEVGNTMAQFPTAEQLASWASLCPGNHESAGKRLRGT